MSFHVEMLEMHLDVVQHLRRRGTVSWPWRLRADAVTEHLPSNEWLRRIQDGLDRQALLMRHELAVLIHFRELI